MSAENYVHAFYALILCLLRTAGEQNAASYGNVKITNNFIIIIIIIFNSICTATGVASYRACVPPQLPTV